MQVCKRNLDIYVIPNNSILPSEEDTVAKKIELEKDKIYITNSFSLITLFDIEDIVIRKKISTNSMHPSEITTNIKNNRLFVKNQGKAALFYFDIVASIPINGLSDKMNKLMMSIEQ